jgi:hypothetical protein
MTLYGVALFIHVVFGVLLVGGSAYAHVAVHLMPRATTVDGARSHVRFLAIVSKSGMPIALVVLIPGIYMAFTGDHWGVGWPGVSLVLFALLGAAAGAIIDPAVAGIQATLDAAPDGPVTPDLAATLANPRLTLVSWMMAGGDLAILFLMTNKPGWTGSVVAGLAGLALGAAVGVRENQHAAAPPATARAV